MLGNHGGAAIGKINNEGNQGGELPAVATKGGGGGDKPKKWGRPNVYLGAACLPLNVLENQTRARSSVPAKPEGEWRAALAAL